jgi:uncharacterized membrane protein
MSKLKGAMRTVKNEVHHAVEYDDSPLPKAQELLEYVAIDSTILPYLKSKADKEQSLRENIILSDIDIKKSGQAKAFTIDLLTLIFAFIIIIGAMAGSIYLILNDKPYSGGVLGGTALLVAASGFLKFRDTPKHQ